MLDTLTIQNETVHVWLFLHKFTFVRPGLFGPWGDWGGGAFAVCNMLVFTCFDFECFNGEYITYLASFNIQDSRYQKMLLSCNFDK